MCVGLLFVIGYSYLLVKKSNNLSPSLAVSLAITITLLLTPYTWIYDQLLLIAPIVILVLLLANERYRYLLASLLFLGVDILALLLFGVALKLQLDIWSASIPLFILCLTVWYILKNKVMLLNAEASKQAPT